MRQAIQSWLIGNVILLSVIGTGNLIAFSVAGYAIRVSCVWYPELTEGQVRAAQYVLDRGLSDPEELPKESKKTSKG